MPIDVTGRKQPNLFSTVTDPATGLTFTPVSGNGVKTKYRVTGDSVPAETYVEARGQDPMMLSALYRRASEPMMFGAY